MQKARKVGKTDESGARFDEDECSLNSVELTERRGRTALIRSAVYHRFAVKRRFLAVVIIRAGGIARPLFRFSGSSLPEVPPVLVIAEFRERSACHYESAQIRRSRLNFENFPSHGWRYRNFLAATSARGCILFNGDIFEDPCRGNANAPRSIGFQMFPPISRAIGDSKIFPLDSVKISFTRRIIYLCTRQWRL